MGEKENEKERRREGDIGGEEENGRRKESLEQRLRYS
jgi:hypothetical protein